MQWRFPEISMAGKPLTIDINGEWGQQSKFPTLLQIYPDLIYTDLIELNYYNMNADYRRIYLHTYIDNPTNYGLEPARNDKWEIRIGAQWDGNSISVTYFREQMNDGFRTSAKVRPYDYRDYDESAIDGNSLSAPPALEKLPYVEKRVLGMYGMTTNGSKMIKEGVEWQMATKRFEMLKTRLTVNGAWFKTTYTNSDPMFRSNTTAVVDGIPVNDLYIGYYENKAGSVREQLNTNIMADTYIPCLLYTSPSPRD